MIITYKFEVLGYAGLCWPSLAFLAFVALDDFLKQKLAFVDKIQAQLTCFQQSDVKTNYQTRSGILKHCVYAISARKMKYEWLVFLLLLYSERVSST